MIRYMIGEVDEEKQERARRRKSGKRGRTYVREGRREKGVQVQEKEVKIEMRGQ